jgi:ribulose 1,5-bisphosphate synthetase/thiazole synthase
MLDEITISKAITENFVKDFLGTMEVDVAIGGMLLSGRRAAEVTLETL